MSRPGVLVLIAHYLPGYRVGGPVQCVSNLVQALCSQYEFRVLTSDRDYGAPAPYAEVAPDQWQPLDGHSVRYLSSAGRGRAALWRLLRAEPERVVYLNSLFERRFSMTAMLAAAAGLLRGKEVICCPHGELMPAALKRRHLRKRAYLALLRLTGMHRRVLWHAVCEEEAEGLRRAFGPGIEVITAKPLWRRPSGARAVEEAPPRAKQPGSLRVVYLSRLQRTKNLMHLIRALRGVRGKVQLDIYGPMEEPAYWQECQEAISELPIGISVRYLGQVDPSEVDGILRKYELFCLPTMTESFGYAIVEALAAGCPVLISDRTPWRGLSEQGAGWDRPLDDPEAFARVLQECVDMTAEVWATHSGCAREWARKQAADGAQVASYDALFQAALVRREHPGRRQR